MSVAIASSQQSFLFNCLTFAIKPRRLKNFTSHNTIISCQYPQQSNNENNSPRRKGNELAKLAIATVAAGVLALGSVGDASAAKSGGRIGGQAFKSSAPRSAPRINNNSRTNIYVNPRVAPPLVGGYGYGYGVPFYGGWGWSPFTFFGPGPSVAVGVGGGFDLLVLFVFIGAAAAFVRRFFGSRFEDDDDDY